jgi:hypothetical protein
MQLYHYFVSWSSEFCHHNTLCCFSTSVHCCKHIFCYWLSPLTFGYTLICVHMHCVEAFTEIVFSSWIQHTCRYMVQTSMHLLYSCYLIVEQGTCSGKWVTAFIGWCGLTIPVYQSRICDTAHKGHSHSNLHAPQCSVLLGTMTPAPAGAGLYRDNKG